MRLFAIPNLSFETDSTEGENYLIVPVGTTSNSKATDDRLDMLLVPGDGVQTKIVDPDREG